MPEVIGALGFGEGVERFADAVLQTVDGALGDALRMRVFSLAKAFSIGFRSGE